MLKDNVARLRQERGLSQDDLAARVHVVRQTVSKWERGASVPDAGALRDLAIALGTTPNELLEVDNPSTADAEVIALEAGLLKEQVAQKTRGEAIYRRTIAITLAVCAVAFVAAVAFTVNLKVEELAQGIECGFDLEGTYFAETESNAPLWASFGLVNDDSGLWQLADFNDNDPVNGRFTATADPNLFTLRAEDGTPVGWASLAYVGTNAGQVQGTLFMQYGEESYRLEKRMRDVAHYHTGEQFGAGTFYALYNRRNADGTWREGGADDDWVRDWFTE